MAGLPYRFIILLRKNSAIVFDSLLGIGWISIYFEKSSTQIIRYLFLLLMVRYKYFFVLDFVLTTLLFGLIFVDFLLADRVIILM